MKKKLFTMFLAVCLAAGSIAVPGTGVLAADSAGAVPGGGTEAAAEVETTEVKAVTEAKPAKAGEESQDWQYTVKGDGTVTIKTYQGTATEVVIPAALEGKAVTAIGERAFSFCSALTKIIIPEGVTTIGNSAFYGCDALTEITIPDSVTVMGESALGNCDKLENVKLPAGLMKISDSMFAYSSALKNVILPENITAIGKSAFEFCDSLESITLPGTLTSIGESAFWKCKKLRSITLPESLVSIGTEAFADCASSFEDTGLESITIPAKVASIGAGAFHSINKLKRIDVAEENTAYTSVGGILFNKAKTELLAYPAGESAEKYEIPSSVQKIGDYAFVGTGLSEIVLPESLQEIGNCAFLHVWLLNGIAFPKNLKAIGESAFDGCHLGNVLLPAGLQTIGNEAFQLCNLTKVVIPASVTNIGDEAFAYNSGLASIRVDAANTVYSAKDNILYNKAKTELLFYPDGKKETAYVIPEGVTKIGRKAFPMSNEKLTSIVVPKHVTMLGYAALWANSLKEVTILNPQCSFCGEDVAIKLVVISTAKIRGYENSTAQEYAQENENPFEVIVKQAEKPAVPAVQSFKAKAAKKKLTLSWKKVSGAAGYQIQISTKSSFKGAKTDVVSKAKNSFTKQNLKSKKNYYVRIRAYKTYKNNEGKTQNAYGKWAVTSLR